MDIHHITSANQIPEPLTRISSPPKELFWAGMDIHQLLERPRLAIVGSRRVSAYGRHVTLELATALAAQGVVIISGMALGVDGLAHRGALDAGGVTIAILPCSLDTLYPTTNAHLGPKIIERGGSLVSEYAPGAEFSFKQNFIARNRLIAGLSNAVLITEAAEKSGSLHTARFALEQGKDVLAVPGNITSPVSVGTNNLLKAGATLVTCAEDVLYALGLKARAAKPVPLGRNDQEQLVLDLLYAGIYDGETLLQRSGLGITDFNQTLTMLEISGKIRSLGVNQWSIK